jgi:hypothetical protein
MRVSVLVVIKSRELPQNLGLDIDVLLRQDRSVLTQDLKTFERGLLLRGKRWRCR